MKKENWENIKDYFHESLERPAGERERYLKKICGDNLEMLEEVQQLLAAYEQNESFLETEAVGEVADLIVEESEKIEDSGQFGRYRIKSLLGEGGMGRVFLVEDVALERFAAVKILTPQLSKDEDRVRRFMREAKAASSLNHPNILTIYEIGYAQDSRFIAAEYVEGETLRQRQNRQPLNLKEVLDIGIQIVSALAAAHKAGILHRDIKPENVMLRRDGIVKVLDFGLAKLLADDAEIDSRQVKTQAETDTAPGIVLGTAAYMSPEQARGKSVDARTDIWSCGVCLYELIAGAQPFSGETMSDVIAEILTREPPSLSPQIPDKFARIVGKTLQKDRANRYLTAEELLADLKSLRRSLEETGETALKTIYRRAEPTAGNRRTKRFSEFSAAVFSNFRFYPIGILAGLLLCITLALAVVFVNQKSRSPQITPEAARWFESGREAARNGNYYKARKLLEQAIRADDRFLQAHAKLAEIQMELDYEDKAAQSMLRVAELMPQYALSEAENEYLAAVLATVRRDNRAAVNAYEEIVAETPEAEKTFAYFDFGRSLEKVDDSERAIAAYLEIVRRDPQFAAAFVRLGNLYWYRREKEKAINAFDRAAAIYTANSDYDGLGELFYQKGALYNYSDDLPEAEKNLKKSLEIAQATANLPLQIKTTLDLGRIGYSNGDTARAQQLIDEALQLSRAENLENLTINGLIDLGTLFYFRGEYEKAAPFLEQALQIARANGAKRSEARALLTLGNLSLLRARPADAVRYIEPARTFYEANDLRQEKSQALLALGYAYDQIGKYEAALKLLGDVLKEAEEQKDQAMTAHAESAIGLALIHSERFSEAIEHCETSFQINQSLGREQIAAYALLNKAQSLVYLGRLKEAGEVLAQTFKAAEKSHDQQLKAWINLLLAKAALFDGQFQQTILESAKSLDESGGQVEDIIVSANLTTALAKLRGGSPEQAVGYFQKADQAVKKIENSRLLPEVWLAQAEIFLREKNFTQALEEAKQARAVFAEQQARYSERRALALAAEAAFSLGDSAGAKENARQFENVSAILEQLWGADNFRSFKTRKDAIFYQSLISKILSEK